jgi:hypothetical protein
LAGLLVVKYSDAYLVLVSPHKVFCTHNFTSAARKSAAHERSDAIIKYILFNCFSLVDDKNRRGIGGRGVQKIIS